MIRYSDKPKDLSNCPSIDDFDHKLTLSAKQLFQVLKLGGIMTIRIGDQRKNGRYYPLLRFLLDNPKIGTLKAILIKIQHNCQGDRISYPTDNPFLIFIKHEYGLIFQK